MLASGRAGRGPRLQGKDLGQCAPPSTLPLPSHEAQPLPAPMGVTCVTWKDPEGKWALAG